MLHVYHRTDCFIEAKGKEDVQEQFNIPYQIICECGKKGDCQHPHSHFLGEFKGQGNHYGRVLGPMFTEQKAFLCKKLKGASTGTVMEKIKQIKHFLNTACYIQTLKGWHKKTHQENPHVFQTLEDNRRFLATFYSEWMWAQVEYMRYIAAKIEAKEALLKHVEFTEDEEEAIRRQIEELDQKLQELEKVWGEEHHYSDEEMEEDLNGFLDQCKPKQ
jgi:hypothetical protein